MNQGGVQIRSVSDCLRPWPLSTKRRSYDPAVALHEAELAIAAQAAKPVEPLRKPRGRRVPDPGHCRPL